MLVSDLTVEVRNSSLTRVGQILASDLIGFQASLRFNNVGAWKLELKSNHPMVSALKTPGSGIIITGKTGVLLSGPTISATSVKTSDDVVGTWEFIGTDDSIILGERLAYPYPASADVSAQADDYDERTGVAETVVKAYVNANIGPSAPAARRVTGLTIQTDTGLGNTVRGFARFDNLGVLCSQLVASSGLGFEIAQVGSGLQFQTFMPTDRSATIRMDIDNLRLTKSEYTFSSPGATRVIVAGQGEGIARTFVEVSNTASTTAETSWARRIETFLDQRQTNDTTALTQAGQGVLAEVGFTREGFSVTPSDDQTMSYGTDWGLGDKVTVVVDTTEVKKVVTEVAIIIDSDGVKVGATVGDPDTANKTDTESNLISTQSSQNDRISVLERNEFPSEKEIIRVANTTGATLTKGTVVYPTGSTGTNKTVAKAQANAEATSTNTFAVLNEDIPNNNKGSAVTFGMVSNIDTSALTEGAAVWLSPTVAGGFTSTKPSAPNHMVLVGFCIRAHASVGSIFVKIQNGFELNELHDVAISAPLAGELIVRNAGNTGWENRTLAEAGIAPIASPTFTGTVSSPTLNVSGTATFNVGGNGVQIKTTSPVDHTYIGLYPRAATPTTRGAYFGYGSNGSTQLSVVNEISGGNLNLITTGAGVPQKNGVEIADRNQVGLVPIIPTSTTGSGGTATIGTNGKVTFTGSGLWFLNGVFTSAYTNYRVIMRGSCDTDRGFGWRFTQNGVQNQNAFYHCAYFWQGGSGMGTGTANSATFIGYSLSHRYVAMSADVFAPNISGYAKHMIAEYTALNSATSGNERHTIGGTLRDLNYVANGLMGFINAGTFTGTIQVFGYNE